MLKTGNSQPEMCMNNLFSMHAGEVFIDQCRGIRADLQDMPAATAYAQLQASAYWVAANYEPRVQFTGLTLDGADKQEHSFTLTSNIQQ